MGSSAKLLCDATAFLHAKGLLIGVTTPARLSVVLGTFANKYPEAFAQAKKSCGGATSRLKRWDCLSNIAEILGFRERAVTALPANFYTASGWRTVRYAALKKSNGLCQCCGASARSGVTLHVDHIKPKSKYPHLALDINNLQVLCEDCNIGKSNTDETDWRPRLKVVA